MQTLTNTARSFLKTGLLILLLRNVTVAAASYMFSPTGGSSLGVREVIRDRIELSSFLIYSINTFTIATGNSTLTMTLTHCYNSLNYH